MHLSLENVFENEDLFSFDAPGDHTQHIQFSDAENYLMNNENQTRREYPLVLILHSSFDEDTNDFFQLVNRRVLEIRIESLVL